MHSNSKFNVRVRDEKKKYKLLTNNEDIPIKWHKNCVHNTNKWHK